MAKLRVVFMGTPDFAVPTLNAIHDSHHKLIAAYTQPPRPAGRGKKLTPSPVQTQAEAHNVPVCHPTSLKSADEHNKFEELNADVAVVAAYGLILPKAILDLPKHGCINLHPSLLPRWRGAAPLQRTLMAGDETSGICIMQMDEGLDTGDVLLREEHSLGRELTLGEWHDQAANRGAELILKVLDQIAAGTHQATPQSTDGVTYANKLTKDETFIDWSEPATSIHNKIRGLSPVPCARMRLGDEVVKLYRSQVSDLPVKGATPGQIIPSSEQLLIATGNGAIEILELQRPGKNRVPGSSILQALPQTKVS